MEYIRDTAKSVNINYLKFGNGDKTMVILPGLSLFDVTEFREAVVNAYSLFTEEFTVFLIDRRRDLPKEYSIENAADDTKLVLDELGIQNAYFLGVSQGGILSLSIAANYPNKVEKFCMASSTIYFDKKTNLIFDKWIDLAKSRNREELGLSFCEAIYSDELFKSQEDNFRNMLVNTTDEELDHFIIMASSMHNINLEKEVSNNHCKAMIIGSKKDKVFSESNMKKMAKELRCNSYFYEGYGHAVYDEAPDFGSRVLEFFKEK